MRQKIALAVALLAALALTGCVKIESESGTQRDAIGNVVDVVVGMCISDAAPPCPAGDTNSNTSGTDPSQLLIAFRIPDAVRAPATISAEYRAPQTGSTTLVTSPSLTSELQAKAPPPAGEKWAGYISPSITTADQHQSARFDVRAAFDITPPADGPSLPSPFRFHTVAGRRAPTPDSSDPVVCAADVTAVGADAHDTRCVDSPKGTEDQAIGGATEVPLADLVLFQPAGTSVQPGQSVSLPFVLHGTRLDGSAPFDLTATTDIPGGTATPAAASASPGAADLESPVALTVPASTPPGLYIVTLSARRGDQTRSAAATINVAAPPAPPPPSQPVGDRTPATVSLARSGKAKLAALLKNGLPLKVTCNEACTAKVALGSRRKPLGSGRGARTSAGSFKVTAKFTRAARKRYARTKKLKLKVLLDVTDTAGNATPKTLTLNLKR